MLSSAAVNLLDSAMGSQCCGLSQAFVSWFSTTLLAEFVEVLSSVLRPFMEWGCGDTVWRFLD
jgi:hypothetical protein